MTTCPIVLTRNHNQICGGFKKKGGGSTPLCQFLPASILEHKPCRLINLQSLCPELQLLRNFCDSHKTLQKLIQNAHRLLELAWASPFPNVAWKTFKITISSWKTRRRCVEDAWKTCSIAIDWWKTLKYPRGKKNIYKSKFIFLSNSDRLPPVYGNSARLPRVFCASSTRLPSRLPRAYGNFGASSTQWS